MALFHPWLFHVAAPNAGTTPRLMLGQNLPTRAALGIYRRQARDE